MSSSDGSNAQQIGPKEGLAMAVMWSRIHEELGCMPTPLTYEMVDKAVRRNTRESDDLDWKDARSDKPETWRYELAKDGVFDLRLATTRRS